MTTLAKNMAENEELRERPRMGLGAALIGKEEEELVLEVLRRQELFRYYGRSSNSSPAMAATLEEEFAAMVGVKHALAVSSGTAALEVALGALGIGPGDEVIVPAWSWVSCFTAVVRVGARPVLAEINETFCIDPKEIGRLRTGRTKAVLVVHYQGVAAEMDEILAEAGKAGIAVIEDCAESVGATYKGKPVGSMGTIGTFSFQYQKVVTSGEGGVVVANDPVLFERAVRMHDLGLVRPVHAKRLGGQTQVPAFAGGQFRLTELQAAVALAQVRKLPWLKEHCRKLQALVMNKIEGLEGVEVRRIPDPGGDLGFETYISLPTPDLAVTLKARLDALNVNCNKMTGTYCHYAREYCVTGHAHAPAASPFEEMRPWPAPGYRKEDFPRTEGIIGRFVALPMGALYTEDDAAYVGAMVRKAWGAMERP